jgi:hypothetical protein
MIAVNIVVMEKVLLKIIEILKGLTTKPVVYGSFGLSFYLGNFKKFGDLDLLVEDRFLEGDWHKLKTLLESNSFILINEKEHEFIYNDINVGFAKKGILTKDKIIDNYNDLVKYKNVNAYTLTPEHFLKAYKFSQQDGYRIANRAKKDQKAIDKILEYIKARQL